LSNIAINAGLGSAASTSQVSINAANAGNISGTGLITVKATGGDVILDSGTGSIGTSTGVIGVSTPAILLNTSSSGTGLVNVKDNLAAVTTLASGATSGGNFTLSTSSSTNISNLSAGDGNISVSESSGTLTVAAGSNITANNGKLTLQAVTGRIVVNSSSTQATAINTTGSTGGAINIVVGAVPTAPVPGTPPANVISNAVGSGQIFYGSKGITVTGTINPPTVIALARFTAINTNLVFNGPTATAITINGGNVTVTADPPLSSSAAVTATNQAAATISLQPSLSLTGAHQVQQENSNVAQTSSNLLSASNVAAQMPGTLASNNEQPSFGVNNALPLNVPMLSNTVSTTLSSQAGLATTTQSASSKQLSEFAISLKDMIDKQNVFPASAQIDASTGDSAFWISDTELTNGVIPAVIANELGVQSANYAYGSQAAKKLDLRRLSSAQAGSKSATFELNKGTVVLAPSVDTVVKTHLGDLHVAANSVVLIMSYAQGLAVYDLHDSHQHAVRFQVGEQVHPLFPGAALVLSENIRSTFEEINPAQLFLYRNMQEKSLSNIKAYEGEFMPLSAIHAVAPLKQLFKTTDTQSKRIGQRVLKTAVSVMQVKGAQPGYQQILHPSLAAWNN